LTGTIIAVSFWAIAEIFADPSLLSSLRTEIATCNTDILSLDIETLIQKPLIQSVYIETLRLKASTLLLRYLTQGQGGLNLNSWVYPKNLRIFVSNYYAQRDE
ncbi:Multidrug resistance protein, partial [Clarireedia jacksonii]